MQKAGHIALALSFLVLLFGGCSDDVVLLPDIWVVDDTLQADAAVPDSVPADSEPTPDTQPDSPQPQCGDGVKSAGEICDGADL